MKRRKIEPTRLIVGFLICAVIALALVNQSGKQAQNLPRAQSGDTTPLGAAGFRLMLARLGYTPKLQTAPLQSVPRDARVWLILDPETRFTKAEAKSLLSWVKGGGTLLFCVRPNSYFLGMPGTGIRDGEQSEGIETLRNSLLIKRSDGQQPQSNEFLPDLSPLALDTVSNYRAGVKSASGSARTLEINAPGFEIAGPPSGSIVRRNYGTGRVFAFPDALLFTNYALPKADNATLLANLIRLHARRGAVYFDERSGGEAAPNSIPLTIWTYLRLAPVTYALGQLAVAAMLFWAFAGRRLGAPVALSPSARVTRASQFAGAMGAVFAKVGRPQAAASIIGARFRVRLAKRLGMSPAESDAVLAQRALEVAGVPFEITDRLLLQSGAPASSAGEALRDAQEMERVLARLEGRA